LGHGFGLKTRGTRSCPHLKYLTLAKEGCD
jgi:hypothetical protein